ncbi:DNA cytosine methyltransferase [Nocardia yamanashiensis]|uniref:DNA cytosine methyltransferase n=1 Tax=Nocardia yamanashiensis TaxID=209247 RepID=UPI00083095F3|nr:DNA cytosine methyltransferase [Nocardia yamanashiensis]
MTDSLFDPFEVMPITGHRPLLLDLFCCAGGAAKGYHNAGFEVVGVDLAPQPNYPFEFHQGDALEFLAMRGHEFAAVHASPPCQQYTSLHALHPDKTYPDLVAATREALDTLGRPYIIENVMSAPLLRARSIMLCGAMFGLRTYRHRRFESRLALAAPAHPEHRVPTATRERRKRWAEGWNISVTGDVGRYVGPEAMGIDWMSGDELCQAIPPAYTEHLGYQLRVAVDRRGRNETRCQSPECGAIVTQPATGRPRRFCSAVCRVRQHRIRMHVNVS